MEFDRDQALYAISVAAELTGVNPQMLRAYENKGLLEPFRTEGGTRRYSGADLDRVNEITTLLQAGLNLAGIERVLDLQDQVWLLEAEVARLRHPGPDTDPAADPTDTGPEQAPT